MRQAGIIFGDRQPPGETRAHGQKPRAMVFASPRRFTHSVPAPHRAAQEKTHQPAGDEFVIGDDQNRRRRHDQHQFARPRQAGAAEPEEQDIEQHLDRNRPGRAIEILILVRRQPLLRHQQAGGEAAPVAGVENEILPGSSPEPELQQRRQQQGCKMQGIEARKAQQRKLRPAGAARGNRRTIEPERQSPRARKTDPPPPSPLRKAASGPSKKAARRGPSHPANCPTGRKKCCQCQNTTDRAARPRKASSE